MELYIALLLALNKADEKMFSNSPETFITRFLYEGFKVCNCIKFHLSILFRFGVSSYATSSNFEIFLTFDHRTVRQDD